MGSLIRLRKYLLQFAKVLLFFALSQADLPIPPFFLYLYGRLEPSNAVTRLEPRYQKPVPLIHSGYEAPAS